MHTIQSKIAISFDDGRQDNVAVIEKLTANGIPATLYVTTGYVDGTCPQDKLPTCVPAMSVDDVKQLFYNPLVEIGMHGDMHLNEDWDIRNGREKLLKWLDLEESHRFGFASPSTAFPIGRFVSSEDPLFARNIAYLATGLRNASHQKLRSLSRKGGRVIHSGLLYKIAYRDTMMQDCPDRVIYRVPVHGDITYKQMRAVVDDAVRSNAAVTFMFHSIGVPDGDTWNLDIGKFSQLCEYLLALRSEDKIELVQVRDIAEQKAHL